MREHVDIPDSLRDHLRGMLELCKVISARTHTHTDANFRVSNAHALWQKLRLLKKKRSTHLPFLAANKSCTLHSDLFYFVCMCACKYLSLFVCQLSQHAYNMRKDVVKL